MSFHCLLTKGELPDPGIAGLNLPIQLKKILGAPSEDGIGWGKGLGISPL